MNMRRAIEKTYDATCNIYIMKKTKEKGITKQEPFLIAENVKCALSQRQLSASNQTRSVSYVDYEHKLFLPPNINVEAGGNIEVTRFGRTYYFKSVGEPFIYDSHQEVIVSYTQRA